MIFHAINPAIVNSHFEYKKDAKIFHSIKKGMNLVDCQLQLADELLFLGQMTQKKKVGRPSSSPKRSES